MCSGFYVYFKQFKMLNTFIVQGIMFPFIFALDLMIYLSSNFRTVSIHYKSETIINIPEDVIVILIVL